MNLHRYPRKLQVFSMSRSSNRKSPWMYQRTQRTIMKKKKREVRSFLNSLLQLRRQSCLVKPQIKKNLRQRSPWQRNLWHRSPS